MPAPSPDQWRALSPMLDVALGMADAERLIWLSSLRERDPSLADQLELLLGHHRAAAGEGFLEECSIGSSGRSGLAGQTLGPYTLISQIGQGGMGSVWLAERSDARFERKVAVKFLNIALIGRAGEERFKREGFILGRLTHPNIAELIDAGVSDAGQPFLVLEHVEGDQIDRYCDQHRLDVEARIRLFLDVLQAISQAHDNLIVHRDLKPSNILVRTDGQVKLLDFGIAKLLDEEQPGTPLTAGGMRAMTPQYAAPEQLTGEAATTATDVYTLGVLLYVLLTGCHPTGAGAHTPADLVRAILDTEPARPSDIVAPTRANAGIITPNAAQRATTPERLSRMLRGDLDTILARALKKKPCERYTSVRAFADDLRRYLGHEPISARPDTIAYRAGKFMRRHRGSVTAAILATLGTIVITITTWVLSRDPGPRPAFNQRKLTANSQDLPLVNAAISPDGKYLGYGDQRGVYLQLLETGGIQTVPLPPGIRPEAGYWVFESWYPDSARFVASVTTPSIAGQGSSTSLWSIAIRGNGIHKLAEVEGMVGPPRVSPDGSKIAYARTHVGAADIGAREIWLMGSFGESPHKIRTAEYQSWFGNIAWSPAGNRIAYSYSRQRGHDTDVWIQSCDLSGANQITMLQENRLNSLAWISSGRLVYSRVEGGVTQSDNLWELKVEDKTGAPQGKARRLTNWSGAYVDHFSATADGKRLVFLRRAEHISVFVGDLAANGEHLANSRRLTLDDNLNIALEWTPDSREVIFSSQRAATRLIYRQGLDRNSAPQLITSTPDTNFYIARLSPDRTSLLLEGEPNGTNNMSLYRVGIGGGVPQLLFHTEGFQHYWCSNQDGNLCVVGQSASGRSELVVHSLDPLHGVGQELLRIPLESGSDAAVGREYAWQLSPDAAWIGLLKKHENQIQLVPLDGTQARVVTVKGYSDLMDLHWATDSRSMFVTSFGTRGATLLHVDLNGHAQPVWHQPQVRLSWGFPSPDGRHLAIVGTASEANAWMISSF